MQKLWPLLLCLLGLFGCNVQTGFEVQDFNPISNYSTSEDTLALVLSMDNAVHEGIQIPESGGAEDDFFVVSFSLTNYSGSDQAYFYQLYFHNETYAWPAYHPRAGENFYGSLSGPGQEFRQSPVIPADGEPHLVRDTFRIQGNPRDEQQFYGPEQWTPTEMEGHVTNQLNYMRELEGDWVVGMKKKARENGRSLEEQMELDARWAVEERRKKSMVNQRERRNPRMGGYSFRLVVLDDSSYARVPAHIRDIGQVNADSQFVHPYTWFDHDTIAPDLYSVQSPLALKTRARFEPANGIFVSAEEAGDRILNPKQFQPGVGTSDSIFYQAHFEQFFHYAEPGLNPRNVREVAHVTGADYSLDRFNAQAATPKEDLPSGRVIPTQDAGTTVGYDADKGALYFMNPGQQGTRRPAKEHVGIRGRVGFTYGRYRAKIHFPELTHPEDHVWNGLTCAFWLIYSEDAPWNLNVPCEGGYIPKEREDSARVRDNSYAEIDIEIVKSATAWPISSYKYSPFDPPKNYDPQDGDLIVSCTNWDLACQDPDSFIVGADYGASYAQDTFVMHRWDHWYKAVTIKSERPREAVVGSEIVFEIDWQPERIIWRMGPDAEHLDVIGYMDADYTVIPSNQMEPVITQEFHLSHWWPMAPFQQAWIPYPQQDLKGYLYSLEVL